MEFNINSRCKVTLTDSGANWINRYNSNKLKYLACRAPIIDFDVLEKNVSDKFTI